MRYKLRSILIGALIVFVIAALGWFFGPSGMVWGVEFSPDRFAHRSFRYYQWCGIPVTFKETHEWQSSVDEYIHKNKWATDSDAPNPRWHFVKGFAPGVRGWSGEAKNMCQSVGCWDDNERWIKWSENHPDLAKIVWPQVVIWARHEKYGEIAYLFRQCDLEKAASTDDVYKKIEIVKVASQE